MQFNKNEFDKRVKETLNVKVDITDDLRFNEDLGADSIDLVELLMVVEEEMNIEIPENVAVEFKTIGDVKKYLESV